MDLQDLRQKLAQANARWSIPDHLGAIFDLADVVKSHGLGAELPPPGTRTTFMPRMRRPLNSPLSPWRQDRPRLRPIDPPLPEPEPDPEPPVRASWDWRNVDGQHYADSSRSQGNCGSCVAFAAAGGLESHWEIVNRNAGLNPDFSEAALFFGNNRVCNGGWNVPAALDYLVTEGACAEVCYPYQPVDQLARFVDGTLRTIRIRGYDSTTNVDVMKRWLVENGPLITTFTVHTDFDVYWNGGHDGIYSHVSGDVRGGHAVPVVGYNNDDGCWICKNSWGGANPFFRIAYDQVGINSRMFLIQDPYEVVTVDELSYDPNALRVVDEGTNGWLLTDGRSRMRMLDNNEDARNALRVARRHTRQGFIGRDNPRPNRADYIVEYWTGNSGLPHEPLTQVDTLPYSPANVVAQDLDADGWRIQDGDHAILITHDMNDALAALQVVERRARIGFIGRNNNRPNRKAYIMTYWE